MSAGISRGMFIAGIVVAVLTSTIISSVITMLWARRSSSVPFVSQHSLNVVTTNSTEWVDLDPMSASITVDGASRLLISFSAEYQGVREDTTTTWVWVRALVDETPAFSYKGTLSGAAVLAIRETVNEEFTYSFFWDEVSAGTYTVKMQWFVGSASVDATAYKSSLVVVALPAQ